MFLCIGKRVKIKNKQGLSGSFDGANRHSPCNKRAFGAPNAIAHKPLRERVIHLLALKPYRTPELLLWLERERASSKDKAELSAVLDEVTHIHTHLNGSHRYNTIVFMSLYVFI